MHFSRVSKWYDAPLELTKRRVLLLLCFPFHYLLDYHYCSIYLVEKSALASRTR